MAKPEGIRAANQKGGVGKSTTIYTGGWFCAGGKESLAAECSPQGDLTKMLGQRKPHGLSGPRRCHERRGVQERTRWTPGGYTLP